nr:DUF2332 family protein [Lentibacter algarum]
MRDQAQHCAALGSPFMELLLNTLADNWHDELPLAKRLAAWDGDIGPLGASLPLRLAGGLHALVINEQDAALAAQYPPHQATALWPAAKAAMHNHAAFLDAWMDNAPQTNEVRRAATLIAAAQLLTARYNLPLRLSELGASGGLNLMFDKFALALPEEHFGPQDAAITLSPEWSGPMPPKATLRVTDRCGVDLNPLDPKQPEDALKLLAYLWPDQPERLERTRAAIEMHDATLTKADAIDWLKTRLARPQQGTLHLVYSTIAWQYFPAAAQSLGTALIEQAGAMATEQAPLAWFAMENDGAGDGAALTLRLWPGDHNISLGRADFHGRWIKLATAALP